MRIVVLLEKDLKKLESILLKAAELIYQKEMSRMRIALDQIDEALKNAKQRAKETTVATKETSSNIFDDH